MNGDPAEGETIMVEMNWTTMTIGGKLSASLVDELQERIDEDFHEQVGESIQGADELCAQLIVQGNVNYSNPDAVEAFCVDHSLPYHIHWAARDGMFDSGIKVWEPGMDKPAECSASSESYDPSAELAVLRTWLDEGKSLADVIAHLARFDDDKIPAFAIVPDEIVVTAPSEVPMVHETVPTGERDYAS
jgi:hypothetical protein